MVDIRQARLRAEEQKLRDYAARHPGQMEILQVSGGTPPTRYVVRLHCRGVADFQNGQPVFRSSHDLDISLPERFPLHKPTVMIRTPVRNPHVYYPNSRGLVCLGEHAWVVSESLDVFVQRLRSILIWDPIIINPRSAADGQAMAWATTHMDQLPLDRGAPAATEAKPKLSWR